MNIYTLLKKYNLSPNDIKYFIKLTKNIVNHEEFKKRSTNPYMHHDHIYLSQHILNDAIVTFVLGKKLIIKYMKKYNISEKEVKEKYFNIDTAIIIAMFHDLYCLPWQNADLNNKTNIIVNKHGFRHPIESIINAYTWFPEYFNNELETKKIIDGVIHHMYPLPVRSIDKLEMELKNKNLFEILPTNIKKEIIISSRRLKSGHVSTTKSKYIEGRIMSKADKIVSISKEIKTLNGFKACVTGSNKNLYNFKKAH